MIRTFRRFSEDRTAYGWRDEVLVEDPVGSALRTARVLGREGAGLLVWLRGHELPIRVIGPAEGRYFRAPDQPSVSARRAILRDLGEAGA